MDIVYPQYWTGQNKEKALKTFPGHLDILKKFWGTTREVGERGERELVPCLLNTYELETEQSLFKICMQNNSEEAMMPDADGIFDENPLSKLWRLLGANEVLSGRTGQYNKLAEMAIVMVMGSVEDERTFSSVAFLKSRVRNSLLKNHLSVVVGMYSQKLYTMENFLYAETFELWYNTPDRTRYGAAP
jgi:hypothetical protein